MRPFTLKCSKRSVRWKRSMKPLDLGPAHLRRAALDVKHLTLKMKLLQRADVDGFVACYRPGERHRRKQTWSRENEGGRWRAFEYTKRDKLNLDLLWFRDSGLEDSENLPEPEVLAAEIVEDLRAALEAFGAIARRLESSGDDKA